MKKPEIVDHLSGLDTGVFERGYHHQVGDGEWYEVFVNKTIKEEFDLDTVAKFLMEFHYVCLKDYEDLNQITFFVPVGEMKYTISYLTKFLSVQPQGAAPQHYV